MVSVPRKHNRIAQEIPKKVDPEVLDNLKTDNVEDEVCEIKKNAEDDFHEVSSSGRLVKAE